jgi:hypothetical protein
MEMAERSINSCFWKCQQQAANYFGEHLVPGREWKRWVKSKREQNTNQDDMAFDLELRSWISNVLVPAMVTDYLAEIEKAESVAAPTGVVAQSEANLRLSAEGIQ